MDESDAVCPIKRSKRRRNRCSPRSATHRRHNSGNTVAETQKETSTSGPHVRCPDLRGKTTFSIEEICKWVASCDRHCKGVNCVRDYERTCSDCKKFIQSLFSKQNPKKISKPDDSGNDSDDFDDDKAVHDVAPVDQNALRSADKSSSSSLASRTSTHSFKSEKSAKISKAAKTKGSLRAFRSKAKQVFAKCRSRSTSRDRSKSDSCAYIPTTKKTNPNDPVNSESYPSQRNTHRHAVSAQSTHANKNMSRYKDPQVNDEEIVRPRLISPLHQPNLGHVYPSRAAVSQTNRDLRKFSNFFSPFDSNDYIHLRSHGSITSSERNAIRPSHLHSHTL